MSSLIIFGMLRLTIYLL